MHKIACYLLSLICCIAALAHADSQDKPQLNFYIVSEEKIENGHYIDKPDHPKLGYISAMPDMVITKLTAVTKSITHSFQISKRADGKEITTPFDTLSIRIEIVPQDKANLAALTKKCKGKRLLMMLGDKILMAPIVMSEINTSIFELSLGTATGENERQKIEEELKKLLP